MKSVLRRAVAIVAIVFLAVTAVVSPAYASAEIITLASRLSVNTLPVIIAVGQGNQQGGNPAGQGGKPPVTGPGQGSTSSGPSGGTVADKPEQGGNPAGQGGKPSVKGPGQGSTPSGPSGGTVADKPGQGGKSPK